MKLTNRRQNGTRLELSMTSMIDVVFLLLIFFIVTTTFVRPERQIQSTIQVSEKKASQDNSNLDPAIIKISGAGNDAMYELGAIQTNNLEEIKAVLRDFENKSEGAFVRAADNVSFEHAAKVIGVCKSAGFATVSYLPTN